MSTTFSLGVYILATTFSPGPNNIMSMSAGLEQGLRKSLPFLLGIISGFFLDMLLAAFFDLALAQVVEGVTTYIKWLGFAYMLYLALSLFLPSHGASAKKATYSYPAGLLLQLINPKVILYGLTLYGILPGSITASIAAILLSGLGLSLVGLVSVLLWCSAGGVMMAFLQSPRKKLGFNLAMAALLVWCAFSVLGLA